MLSSCGQPPTPPTIQSFTADQTLVTPGNSGTLSWKTTGADSVSINPVVGAVSPAISGSKVIPANANTAFTLTAKNAGGSATATVAVTFISAIQGNVYQTIASGGQPLLGAKVTAWLGSVSQTTTTGTDGSFQVALPTTAANANAFSLTVEPLSSSVYQAITHDTVPLADYAAPYGAANEMNIYLGEPP